MLLPPIHFDPLYILTPIHFDPLYTLTPIHFDPLYTLTPTHFAPYTLWPLYTLTPIHFDPYTLWPPYTLTPYTLWPPIPFIFKGLFVCNSYSRFVHAFSFFFPLLLSSFLCSTIMSFIILWGTPCYVSVPLLLYNNALAICCPLPSFVFSCCRLYLALFSVLTGEKTPFSSRPCTFRIILWAAFPIPRHGTATKYAT